MTRVKRLDNGFTPNQARDWQRACRWAKAHVEATHHVVWHDNSIAYPYMAARNGYLAGYRAGIRARRR